MTYEEFTEWIESLELQTFTDELKAEILKAAESMYWYSTDEGYERCREDVVNQINGM